MQVDLSVSLGFRTDVSCRRSLTMERTRRCQASLRCVVHVVGKTSMVYGGIASIDCCLQCHVQCRTVRSTFRLSCGGMSSRRPARPSRHCLSASMGRSRCISRCAPCRRPAASTNTYTSGDPPADVSCLCLSAASDLRNCSTGHHDGFTVHPALESQSTWATAPARWSGGTKASHSHMTITENSFMSSDPILTAVRPRAAASVPVCVFAGAKIGCVVTVWCRSHGAA